MFHEKYGHVVRLSPSIISISDKDMMKQILVTDDLPKSPVYDLVARMYFGFTPFV
jgi:hypothetical protein